MEFLFPYVVVCLSLFQADEVNGSRIIMAGPQAPSHVMVQSAVASELINKGHEVYMALGSRIENPAMIERLGIKILYYHIPHDVIFGLTEEFDKAVAECVFSDCSPEYLASLTVTRDCSLMMQDDSFKRKAKALKFDLAFVEPFIYAPCNLILGRFLEIPFVSMATLLQPWELRVPANPSFYRVLGWYPVEDLTTFTGRIKNLAIFIISETSMLVPGPRNTTLLQQYAPELQSWKELIRKSELILSDIDHHMGLPMPAFPNFVTVPGLSVRPANTLGPALEALFSANKYGIIVMSLGSMVHHIPRKTMQSFFEAFSRLKQTVVARMEPPTDGTTVPKNVKLFSSLPQNDVLGHANTKLFITHCGNSGQYEMLYHGVPFVGFPMFGDQDMNCHLAQERGYGLKLNIFKFNSEELFNAIEEILNNENYKKAIKRASQIFKEEPMSGREKAAHWIEHVIKYGGGHLRSSALDLPLYQFLMLDVLGLLLFCCLTIFWLIKYLKSVVLRKIGSRVQEGSQNVLVTENRGKVKFN